MDSQKAFLVIGATLVIVLLFNLSIYVMAKRRRGSNSEVEMIRRAMKTARHPWQAEQANLDALAEQVASYKNQPSHDDPKQATKDNHAA